MIQLTVLLKRNPALTIEEFHERWRAHGRTIAGEPTLARHIRRYEQHHRAIRDYESGDTYDGLAVQQYDDMDGFLAFLAEPAYAELIRPDEEALLDMGKLVVLFTDPAEVFVG
jgi:hypothetical protein